MNQWLGQLAQKSSKSQRSNEINDLAFFFVQRQKTKIGWGGSIPYHDLCA